MNLITPVSSILGAADSAVHVLHRDFESRGTLDLRRVGVYKYGAHSDTEVICCAYAVDDDPVQLWIPGNPVPPEFIEAARNPEWIAAAHNDQFETLIERYIMGPRYSWPVISATRHRCTMTMALAAGLPAKLDRLADFLELANRKDAAGERLMHQMSKPRKPRKGEDPEGVYWFDDPERLQRLYDYCRQDVEVERELYGQLKQLPESEHALWLLSNTICDRGFAADHAFVTAAKAIAAATSPGIDGEIAELTDGAVTSINQVGRLTKWLCEHGYAAKSLGRKAVERQLQKEDLAPELRRVLELRLGGAKAAVRKFDAFLVRAGNDGRIRGAFRFHGTRTGRWSGQGFQPQNLKRPEIGDVEAAVAAVLSGDVAHVLEKYPKPLAMLADVTHAMIVAAPGHELIGADFSTIESRCLAWLSNETSKLDVFRTFDATGDFTTHPYVIAAAKALKLPASSIKKHTENYHVGKVSELAFGYQGGIGAWRQFDLDRQSDEEVLAFRDAWRASHPNIVRFWYALNDAALNAVHERGKVTYCANNRIRFKAEDGALLMRLPSGRKLCYPSPRIIETDRGHSVIFVDNKDGRVADFRGYGGSWCENCVSGIARDLLVAAMLRIEAANYPIIITVHDEIVAEVPEGFGSTDELSRLMTRRPAWALDLPIAAEAWRGKRYQK
jgi:DNA polymerase bacteriophage-type